MKSLIRLFSASKSLTLYEAPYYESLKNIKVDFIREASEIMKSKYHQFIPFYLESRLTPTEKLFVLKMELVPSTSSLKVTSLQLGSLYTKNIPISNLVPVTHEDYEISHFGGKLLESAEFFDIEMIYINRPEQEFLIFDKDGTWNEEVVNSEALSLKNTFNEHRWYDYGCGPKTEHTGGNALPLP